MELNSLLVTGKNSPFTMGDYANFDFYRPTFGQYFGAVADNALSFSPTQSLVNLYDSNVARRTGEPISYEDWKVSEFYRPGLKWVPGMTDAQSELVARIRDEDDYRNSLIEQYGDYTGRMVFEFGVSVGASMFDPINLATGFIPFSRAASGAYAIGTGLKATSSRMAINARYGFRDNMIAGALVEPMSYIGSVQTQRDYTMYDSLVNVLAGGVIGAGFGMVGGEFGALLARRRLASEIHGPLEGMTPQQRNELEVLLSDFEKNMQNISVAGLKVDLGEPITNPIDPVVEASLSEPTVSTTVRDLIVATESAVETTELSLLDRAFQDLQSGRLDRNMSQEQMFVTENYDAMVIKSIDNLVEKIDVLMTRIIEDDVRNFNTVDAIIRKVFASDPKLAKILSELYQRRIDVAEIEFRDTSQGQQVAGFGPTYYPQRTGRPQTGGVHYGPIIGGRQFPPRTADTGNAFKYIFDRGLGPAAVKGRNLRDIKTATISGPEIAKRIKNALIDDKRALSLGDPREPLFQEAIDYVSSLEQYYRLRKKDKIAAKPHLDRSKELRKSDGVKAVLKPFDLLYSEAETAQRHNYFLGDLFAIGDALRKYRKERNFDELNKVMKFQEIQNKKTARQNNIINILNNTKEQANTKPTEVEIEVVNKTLIKDMTQPVTKEKAKGMSDQTKKAIEEMLARKGKTLAQKKMLDVKPEDFGTIQIDENIAATDVVVNAILDADSDYQIVDVPFTEINIQPDNLQSTAKASEAQASESLTLAKNEDTVNRISEGINCAINKRK